MKDPERLRERTDLPDALQDALRGLARNTPPADAVARIQRSLSRLPPPPPAASGGPALGWSTGVYAPAAAALAVVAVAAAVWMRAPTPKPHDAKGSATTLQSAPPTPRELPAAVRDVPAPPLPAATRALPRTASERASSENTTPAQLQQRVTRAHTPALPHHRANGLRAKNAEASEANDTMTGTDSASIAETLQPVATRGPMPMERAPKKAQARAPEDEAGLLYRAKQAARTDRQAAFRLLDLHAQYFPSGTLAEEREVLAIDLLRRMGRASEANTRTAHFLVRFPESSYRNAVLR